MIVVDPSTAHMDRNKSLHRELETLHDTSTSALLHFN